MHYLALLTILLLAQQAQAQTTGTWIKFVDEKTETFGYKDLQGRVKVPARLQSFNPADSFYNIVAVYEIKNDKMKSYYLLKDGRRAGVDSVYMFDFTYDCESEGKIIFNDKKTDRVGFFDANGQVRIPAVYNWASPFKNGYSVALRNAWRYCYEGRDTLSRNCEHLGWKGGELVLVNDKNEVLVNNWRSDNRTVNWYSMQVDNPAVDTHLYVTVAGNNGHTYSFIDYQQEFEQWYRQVFVPALASGNSQQVAGLCYTNTTYWDGIAGEWQHKPAAGLLSIYPVDSLYRRFQPGSFKTLSINPTDLNQFIFEDAGYRRFYNACGQHNYNRYPVFDVMVNHYAPLKKGTTSFTAVPPPDSDPELMRRFYREYTISRQDDLEFIRTENGYRLLSVSLK